MTKFQGFKKFPKAKLKQWRGVRSIFAANTAWINEFGFLHSAVNSNDNGLLFTIGADANLANGKYGLAMCL